MLRITRLLTENLEKECITDQCSPSFSFSIASDRENVYLKEAILSVNGWQIKTTEQTGIRYGGHSLQPFTSYQVSVEAMDNYGEKAVATMAFEMGRLDTPWQAKWISDPFYHFREPKVSPRTMTFRTELACRKKIKKARLYATAFGIYELLLNGEKVGLDYFAPGFTSYKHQLQYQTYDVTDMLKQNNQLLAVVGGGWAVGAFTYKRRNRVYAKRQGFLCEIRIVYQDGTEEIVGTDSNWQVTEDGNYQMTEFYNGECYDATKDLTKVLWKQAAIEHKVQRAYDKGSKGRRKLLAQYGVPVRGHEIYKPISCIQSKSGEYIYDFGQNFAGVISAIIEGKKGQKICFRHAEILMDGELYTEPLRTAKQEVIYTCVEGNQYYSPRMTYMGFRYVGVTGIKEGDLSLSAIAIYSNIEENGSFSCSNELVNKLQECIRWGAKSNFVDIPTDCPQRDERMGWTGDIALFAPTAAYNFDTSRFLEKWLLDVRAEQGFGGGIPVTVPLVRVPWQWEIMIPMAVDHWGDACILVPWAEYRARGNADILKQMYPTMKRYIKACAFWAKLGSIGKQKRIWRLLHHYGDWCAPGVSMWGWMARGKWTATACLAYSSGIVARVANLLGESKDAAYYEKMSKETAMAYRTLLMDQSCVVHKEFQTAYVLPLYYQMLEEQDRQMTAAHLARMVRENQYHIGTGFPGTPYILFALCDNGYVEEAYAMLLQESCPSWLYEVKAGGTTIWERWDALRGDGTCNTGADDGTGGMVSFNHYASGAVGDFFYRRIAGIEALEGGYRTFQVAPVMGGSISFAKGEVMTPYGKISSQWSIEKGCFVLEVEVPVSTNCQVKLPSGKLLHVGSGKHRFTEQSAVYNMK